MSDTTTLGPRRSFKHGVHPDEHKSETAALPIERMPFVDEYVLPLSQHIGAPSKPIVEPGQRVERGQMIAEPGGFVSVALHSPVTGTVRAIELRPHPAGTPQRAIVIDIDRFASQRRIAAPPPPAAGLPVNELAKHVQQAGLVGLGGAAFPAHVKLSVPKGKHVRFIILNGCECEPFLTCDHRVMVERSGAVLRGLDLLMRATGAESGYIGIEINKPDAIEAMHAAAAGDRRIEIVPLQVKYPEGAEKMLIDAVLRVQVPVGKIPLDLEIIVNNVGTSAALADLLESGLPLIERVVTVTGPGVRRPSNLLVPIGTPVSALIDHCGGLRPETRQIIMGGPMMGSAQTSLSVPVLKGTSGIVALTSLARVAEEEPCIRCGRCLEACAMFLNPARLAALSRAGRADDLREHNVMACFECASCSFVCPSNVPIVQLIRTGKALLRKEGGK